MTTANLPTEAEVDNLRSLFDRISNPNDWRAPISAVIPKSALPEFSAAVDFFTATQLEVVADLGISLQVRAIGYRNGPAGP